MVWPTRTTPAPVRRRPDHPRSVRGGRPSGTAVTPFASIETGASFMDRNDSEDTADCPWCAALHEAGLPPAAQPSGSPGRRHDPYVSGAPYDGDDW